MEDPLADSSSEDEGYRYCLKCSNYKPPRAHHCRACNRCILRMDHHCPWINNCVGFHNHKFFLLFLVYVSFTVIYCASMSLVRLVQLLQREETSEDPWATIGLIMLLTLASPLGLAVCILLCWQFWLLKVNCTTIEAQAYQRQEHVAGQQRRNFYWPFDLGFVNNVKAVMGQNSSFIHLFLPTTPKEIGTGLVFPLNPNYSEMVSRMKTAVAHKRAASAPALTITNGGTGEGEGERKGLRQGEGGQGNTSSSSSTTSPSSASSTKQLESVVINMKE